MHVKVFPLAAEVPLVAEVPLAAEVPLVAEVSLAAEVPLNKNTVIRSVLKLLCTSKYS